MCTELNDFQRCSVALPQDLVNPVLPLLPKLSQEDIEDLTAGKRVQKQDRIGRAGSGVVVMDIQASEDDIFNSLKQFDKYDQMIPTVRSVKIFQPSNESCSMAEFRLSKFYLKVNVVHSVYLEQKLIRFSLDKSKSNLVLREADGFWLVEKPKDRQDGISRVWLSARIVASRLVPPTIVDYAAARALPRATTWLETYFQKDNPQLKIQPP